MFEASFLHFSSYRIKTTVIIEENKGYIDNNPDNIGFIFQYLTLHCLFLVVLQWP